MAIGKTLSALVTAPVDQLAARMTGIEPGDFSEPAGEPSLLPPDAISWHVFGNPVSLYVGGIAAVLLELGEPRVRHGVWDHSSFKTDPGGRLRRTGRAAMMTVYGARSRFEAMAARVRRMHEAIVGTTPAGAAYRADDPVLLMWVQTTAAWGFLEAYRRFVRPVGKADRDLYYAEGQAAGALYGVERPLTSEAEVEQLFEVMMPGLERSDILDELLAILDTAPILPVGLRGLQPVATRAAVDLLPEPIRFRLGLDQRKPLGRHEEAMLRGLARIADRLPLSSSPAAQALKRMGLPADYLRRRERSRALRPLEPARG